MDLNRVLKIRNINGYKDFKKCTTSLTIRKKEIKTTLRAVSPQSK